MKKAFIISILFSSTSVFGTKLIPLNVDQQKNEPKIEISKNFLSKNLYNPNICNMSFDEALKKGDGFAKEYLYAWGASVSFTRQDRDANLRVLCENIGSFLLVTALNHGSHNIVKFLKDHGADVDKILNCMMLGTPKTKI